MSEKYSSQSQLESSLSYEYLPRQQSLKRPEIDTPLKNNSVMLNIMVKNNQQLNTPIKTTQSSQQHSVPRQQIIPYQNQRIVQNQYEKIINQQSQTIQRLQNLLSQERQEHQFQKRANLLYTQMFNKLKTVFSQDSINGILNKIQSFNGNYYHKSEIQSLIEQKKHIEEQLKRQMQINQNKISQLRNQLLKSSENNIFALLNTSIVPTTTRSHSSSLSLKLNEQIIKINRQIQNIKDSFRRLQSVKQSQNKQRKDKIIKETHQNFNHNLQEIESLFNKIKLQQKHSTLLCQQLRKQTKTVLAQQKQKCQNASQNKQLIYDMTNKMNKLIQSLNIPQKVWQDHRSIGNSGSFSHQLFLNEIKLLNDKIKDNEEQLEKQKLQNYQLENRIHSLQQERSHMSSSRKLSKLQNKLKQKNKRILELQNTIYDHLELNSHKQITKTQNIQNIQNHAKNLSVLLSQSKKNNQELIKELRQVKNQLNSKQQLLSQILIQLGQFEDQNLQQNLQVFNKKEKNKELVKKIIQNIRNEQMNSKIKYIQKQSSICIL